MACTFFDDLMKRKEKKSYSPPINTILVERVNIPKLFFNFC